LKFLIDTNILISAALFPNGKVSFVLSHILESHKLIISSYSLVECKTVFARKFTDKMDILIAFLKEIDFETYQTPTEIDRLKFPYIRDEKDLPILVSAILSDADILLTGDKDFQSIPHERPIIFTPSEYFDLIED